MAFAARHPPPSRGLDYSSNGYGQGYSGSGSGMAPLMHVGSNSSTSGFQNPGVVYQQIHDMASKRISTLDYLRKAHEGRVYWFNTLLFNKIDLAKLPYFDPRRLARRATNYLLLGFSLPAILDLNAQSLVDYLRALNALLADFEHYQTAHPPEGGGPSSLARGRIPQMFKRATAAAGGRGRRSSSTTTDIGAFPMASGAVGGGSDPLGGIMGMSFGNGATDSAKAAATLGLTPTGGTNALLSAGEAGGGGGGGDLLPGEEYSHLLTPSLPFDPDYFETFATLCDVLIDCYAKVMSLAAPESCTTSVGELFSKADARIRKIIVAGVVREFEDASRLGTKTEIAGVGKVVLGGLM